MGEWISIPDGPSIPKWLTSPSKIEEKVIEFVGEWLIGGLWDAAVEFVGWIQELVREAVIEPSTAAGRSVERAGGSLGDVVLSVARLIVGTLESLAASSPLSIVIVGALAGVVLVAVVAVLRSAVESFKLLTWK